MSDLFLDVNTHIPNRICTSDAFDAWVKTITDSNRHFEFMNGRIREKMPSHHRAGHLVMELTTTSKFILDIQKLVT